jgi:Mn2+/Fe2+ NRAMP family transporter
MSRQRSALTAAGKSLLSGLVSAASDNDPTTVGTVAVAGAMTLYGLEWLLVLLIPMLAVVQMLGTQVAGVTRRGLQAVVRDRYGPLVAFVSMLAIVGVNSITLGADLQAGAASLHLLTGIAPAIWAVPLAVVIGTLLSVASFDRVRAIFAVLPLAFLAYAVAAFLSHPNWHAVARGFIPRFSAKHEIGAALALLGTTLTAYAYYWQTVEVATDRPPRRKLRTAELATLPGIIFTFTILWFILTATAATLGVHHHPVTTAQDAAGALAPFAGRWAPIVFAVGLLGSSLLAVPVIAAANANAVCVTLRWRGSLNDSPRAAPRHYAVIYLSLGVAAAIAFARVPTITLLFIASIAGGLTTPLTLGLLMLLARDRSVMHKRTAPVWAIAAGWAVAAIVTAAAIGYIVTS